MTVKTVTAVRTGLGLAALAAVAVPPLVLAGAGLAHPMDLTTATAEHWRDLHLWLLPVFPLLAFGPWVTVRAHAAPAPVRWAVVVLGYVYAVAYTALDVLAGVGGGAVQAVTGDQTSTEVVVRYGNDLATVGVYAYLLATVVAAIVATARARLGALPGAVLVLGGAYSFLDSHIMWPRGVVTMLVLGFGWSVLLMASRPGPSRAGDRGAAGHGVEAVSQPA